MTALCTDLAGMLRAASTGSCLSAVHRAARRAFAADITAAEASDDDSIREAAELAIDAAHDVAAIASSSTSAIGIKLAMLIRLKSGAYNFDMTGADSAELILLASALADCVILSDTPIDASGLAGSGCPGPSPLSSL